jgi:hypothetical protein
MRLIPHSVNGLVACAVLALATSLMAETGPGIAKVVRVKGAARYMTTENPTWRPLKSGSLLKSGTTIQTAAASEVDLVLNNPDAAASVVPTASVGGIPDAAAPIPAVASKAPPSGADQDAIRVYENTVLGLDTITLTQTGADRVTDTQLDLKYGRVMGSVKKLSAASRYEVKIPNGVAGIRGTIYTLTADGVLTVLQGSVILAFVGPDGNPVTQEIGAGQQYNAKTGQTTNLPAENTGELIRQAHSMGQQLQHHATEFAVDETVYYVSPVKGQANAGSSSAALPNASSVR